MNSGINYSDPSKRIIDAFGMLELLRDPAPPMCIPSECFDESLRKPGWKEMDEEIKVSIEKAKEYFMVAASDDDDDDLMEEKEDSDSNAANKNTKKKKPTKKEQYDKVAYIGINRYKWWHAKYDSYRSKRFHAFFLDEAEATHKRWINYMFCIARQLIWINCLESATDTNWDCVVLTAHAQCFHTQWMRHDLDHFGFTNDAGMFI